MNLSQQKLSGKSFAKQKTSHLFINIKNTDKGTRSICPVGWPGLPSRGTTLILKQKNRHGKRPLFHSSTPCYSRREKHDIDYPMITEESGLPLCPASGAGFAETTFPISRDKLDPAPRVLERSNCRFCSFLDSKDIIAQSKILSTLLNPCGRRSLFNWVNPWLLFYYYI